MKIFYSVSLAIRSNHRTLKCNISKNFILGVALTLISVERKGPATNRTNVKKNILFIGAGFENWDHNFFNNVKKQSEETKTKNMFSKRMRFVEKRSQNVIFQTKIWNGSHAIPL